MLRWTTVQIDLAERPIVVIGPADQSVTNRRRRDGAGIISVRQGSSGCSAGCVRSSEWSCEHTRSTSAAWTFAAESKNTSSPATRSLREPTICANGTRPIRDIVRDVRAIGSTSDSAIRALLGDPLVEDEVVVEIIVTAAHPMLHRRCAGNPVLIVDDLTTELALAASAMVRNGPPDTRGIF